MGHTTEPPVAALLRPSFEGTRHQLPGGNGSESIRTATASISHVWAFLVAPRAEGAQRLGKEKKPSALGPRGRPVLGLLQTQNALPNIQVGGRDISHGMIHGGDGHDP